MANTSGRSVIRSLLAVNDGPWRWRAGLEAGLATAVPLGVLTLFGHQSLGLIASLGSFTALFFSQLHRVERCKGLTLVGAGMIAASAVGVTFAGSAWLTVLGVMLVASLACLMVLGFRVGAPGPLHFILVTGVSGHLASPVHLGGAGVGGGLVVLMVAAGALSSLLVVLTAVAILQASHRVPLTLMRAAQRILGTLVGVMAFALFVRLDIAGAWLVLVVVGLEFMIELVIAKNYGLGLMFITPLALIISTANVPGDPLGLVGERVTDTFLGALIALAVLFAAEWLRRRMARRN